MSVQQKRKYDSEFKRNAVLLSKEPGRKVPEVAESLGIKNDLIYLAFAASKFTNRLKPLLSLGFSRLAILVVCLRILNFC